MSGGGSSPAPQPSTTTQVNDIPVWEQGYVKDLLGKATAISNQPYQQFNGPQVAGFTQNQNQAFANIGASGAGNLANQAQAMGQAQQGASSANSIFGAGAGDINAATQYNPLEAVAPYLGAASQYNSAAAGQPWLQGAAQYSNAAANAATPQGIQQYLNPYTSNVVQGLQNEANQNWSQNIMPGVNDKFIGSGQYASGRNAQVLGQAAGNFQTGLSANVANALAQGYNTAGQQAGQQASLLGNLGSQALQGANTAGGLQTSQIGNLLNQGQAAGTATGQQASNLLNQGTALGNLATTQTGQQLNAANTIGNLGSQAAQTNMQQNQALQAVGQQQQQLNQTNLDVAKQNFQNQVNYPAQQTQYLNQIIRGLPTPTASTSASQITPAYSVSPLSALGGTGASALSLLSQAQGHKKGGLIKGYAKGGSVDDTTDEDITPLDHAMPPTDDEDNAANYSDPYGEMAQGVGYKDAINPLDMPTVDDSEQSAPDSASPSMPSRQQESTPANPLDIPAPPKMQQAYTPQEMQRNQLLALARGMLTPSLGGSTAAAMGLGLGNMQDIDMKQHEMMISQQQQNYENQLKQAGLGLEQQKLEQGKYTVTPDQLGGFIKVNNKTGDVQQIQGGSMGGGTPAVDKSGAPLTGAAYLATLDPRLARTAKMVGDADMAFPAGFALKSPYWQNVLAAAQQYNPDLNANQFPSVQKFNVGKQGDTVRSLNVATAHLDTLDKLTDALGNGDTKALNTISNTFQSQFGKAAPTNFDTAKQIVADEVTKAVIGTGGTGADREKAADVINKANSPQQLHEAIATYKTLMSGQLTGLQKQYETSTGRKDFADRYLTSQARTALGIGDGPSQPSQNDPLAALLAEKARRQKDAQ